MLRRIILVVVQMTDHYVATVVRTRYILRYTYVPGTYYVISGYVRTRYIFRYTYVPTILLLCVTMKQV